MEDTLLGWDTDQFPTDPVMCAKAMLVVLKQGGIGSGGLNFDAKPRRGAFDGVDLFYAHISGMDAFARGLLAAHQIIEDGILDGFIEDRYVSYGQGLGKEIMSGDADFESLEKWILENDEPTLKSGRQEMLEYAVAVSGVQADQVKARGFRAQAGIAVPAAQVADVFFAHRARANRVGSIGSDRHCRRRQRHFLGIKIRAVDTGISQLGSGERAVFVRRVRHLGEYR